MNVRVVCVTSELWEEAAGFLDARVSDLERATRLRRDEASVLSGDGIGMSPCTTQLWASDVGIEHEEYTCYFRHWFRKVDGKLEAMKFSHLALMPLVRACVWQALLYEFITGMLCGREAVRLRVEDELTSYSNCVDKHLVKRIGILAQDMFNLVKCNLSAKDRPLNRVGLGMAERMVIHMQKLDYRNKRKGWSNRAFRKYIVAQLVDSGLWDIKSRQEQEAFIGSYISSFSNLKVTAAKDIVRSLSRVFDTETGECILRPWSKEELNAMRRETLLKRTWGATSERAAAIREKIAKGERLTGAERKFKCKHKELFEGVTKVETICKVSIDIQNVPIPVTPKSKGKPRLAKESKSMARYNPTEPIIFSIDSYGDISHPCNRRRK